MRTFVWLIAGCIGLGTAGQGWFAAAAEQPAFDTTKRVPWTSSKIRGTPDPANPYVTEIAFPKAKFFEPLEVTLIPGTSLLAVAERPGKVFALDSTNRDAEKRPLFDTGRVTYGLEFHPQFAKNGFVFVATEKPLGENGPYDIEVQRYHLDPQTLKPDGAAPRFIISWRGDGHRGGCIRFGHDGLLYCSVGDGSGIADSLLTGQDLTDLLGSMLRIDVDRAGDKPYAVPADNPFVGVTGVRPEVWAYGLRQAWKFSFHPRTGDLWAGEVGQDLWEMVYILRRGGNYGWSVREGLHPFRPERPLGPTQIESPIVEHPHTEFRSVTGGHFWGANRLPELRGAYVYGDFDTGKIWMLRHTAGRVSDHRELVDTQLRVVAFGQDRAGEVLAVDFTGGFLHRLVPAPPVTAEEDSRKFPRKLSETGLFASTKDHVVAPGVIPYSVNSALWSDGAAKERFLALPGTSQIEFETVTYPQPAPGSLPGWRFPSDAVLVKTFAIEMETGNPKSLRRLETRLLHKKRMPGSDEYGDDHWLGYTYVWNDDQTDAELLDTDGRNVDLTIADKTAPGGKRTQTWRFPSRAECTLCHTMSAKFVLGVTTQQMNRLHDYGGTVKNQLEVLNRLGVFTKPLPEREHRKLPDYDDKRVDIASRARAYLDANCAHCHRKWGGGNAEFQLLASLPLKEMGIVDVRPQHGPLGLNDPKLIVPGDPSRSILLHRMQRTGLGRMPHIASNVVHDDAVKLIEQWIRELKP